MAFQEAPLWGDFYSKEQDTALLTFAELLAACPAETLSWALLKAAYRTDEVMMAEVQMHSVVNQARELRLLPGMSDRKRLLKRLSEFNEGEKRHFIAHTSNSWRQSCQNDDGLHSDSVKWN